MNRIRGTRRSRGTLAAAGLCAALLPGLATAEAAVHKAEVAQAGMQARIEAGKAGFEKYCQSCHQADGKGMGNVFPPLAGSDYLLSEPERAIDVVLQGLSGPIEVNGQKFDAGMPHLNYLTDEQVAETLSYVLNSWGNQGGYIMPEQVAARRQALADAEGVKGGLHPGVDTSRLQYEGAASPIGSSDVRRLVSTQGPEMTEEEFAEGTKGISDLFR